MNTLTFNHLGYNTILTTCGSLTKGNFLTDIKIFLNRLSKGNFEIQSVNTSNLSEEMSLYLDNLGIKNDIRKKKVLNSLKKGEKLNSISEEDYNELNRLLLKDLNSKKRVYKMIVSNSDVPIEMELSRIEDRSLSKAITLLEHQVYILKRTAEELLRFLDVKITDSDDVLEKIQEYGDDLLSRLTNKFEKYSVESDSLKIMGRDVLKVMEYTSPVHILSAIKPETLVYSLKDIESFRKSLSGTKNNEIIELYEKLSNISTSRNIGDLIESYRNIDENDKEFSKFLTHFFALFLSENSKEYYTEIRDYVCNNRDFDVDEFDLNLDIYELIELGFTGLGYNKNKLYINLDNDGVHINYISKKFRDRILKNENIRFILNVLPTLLNSEKEIGGGI